MAIVNFTLNEDGVAAFQNALACILKFSDDVSLDAKRDRVSLPSVRRSLVPRVFLTMMVLQLALTALNLSQSAYLSFTFVANRFFSSYDFHGGPQHRNRFFCVLYIRVGQFPWLLQL